MAETMTGGGAIVQALLDHGVDTVFGLPGVQTYAIFDALARNADRIRTYSARHEQASAYMAFGYAQATGRAGVFSVVPGPGVMNTMAALSNAWGCNIPVLCITGQVPRPFLEAGRGHLHEIPDQIGAVARFCKYAARIERPEDAPKIVSEASRYREHVLDVVGSLHGTSTLRVFRKPVGSEYGGPPHLSVGADVLPVED